MVSLEFHTWQHIAILYLAFSYLISYRRGIFTREFEFSLAMNSNEAQQKDFAFCL